jgi:thioredoxin 1
MSIISVETFDELKAALEEVDDYAIIDFHASWCAPCKMMSPIFEKVSETVEDVTFIKCLVDDVNQYDFASIPALESIQVRSIPYFVMFSKENADILFSKNGTMSADNLENLIEGSK